MQDIDRLKTSESTFVFLLGILRMSKRVPQRKIPEWLQARTKVYVRMTIPEGKWQTEACIGYHGYAKKAFRFDKNNENSNVSMDDNDTSCACR
jgi:hypothetical protein